MKVGQDDIRGADIFAVGLKKASDEMLSGKPMSQALLKNGIGMNTFLTLVKSLRRTGRVEMPDGEHLKALRHPAWQDELACDLCGEDGAFIPEDFEDELKALEDKFLDEKETAVIELVYKDGKSIKEAAKAIGIDASNAGVRKNHALGILREHREELFAGKKFMESYEKLREAYDENAEIIRWMDEAREFLEGLGESYESKLPEMIEDFCRWNGLRRLKDIYGIKPETLLGELEEFAERRVELPEELSGDMRLTEMDFSNEAMEAFEDAGLITVDDALSLSDEEAAALPKAGRAGIIRLYRMALRGRKVTK